MASAHPDRLTGRGPRTFPPLALAGGAALGILFVTLPLVGLVLRAPWRSTLTVLGSPEALDAIRLSLLCSLSATALGLLLGVPLAWVQARVSYPGRSVVRALTTLPMVLPPVVGGVALLFAFGRAGLLGGALFNAFGVQLPFSTAGVIMAETFVSMPFLVLTVEAGFRGVNPRLEEAARTLGAGQWRVFRTITLPLAAPSVFAGAVLCWSRALGEFGATITFAGNLPGQTQTLPLAVYVLLETRPEAALLLSIVMVVVSVVVLVALRDRYLRIG
ncbi:MAG: ABC transporter permease [Candidatus Dormiibacterota bacterium]